jgi:hypothetical protein
MDRRKARKISVRIADVPAAILTEHLPNANLECYCCPSPLRLRTTRRNGLVLGTDDDDDTELASGTVHYLRFII